MKLSLLAREIRGQSLTGNVEKQFGGGASISGKFITPYFDERSKQDSHRSTPLAVGADTLPPRSGRAMVLRRLNPGALPTCWFPVLFQ
jgi:hypothetical protein